MQNVMVVKIVYSEKMNLLMGVHVKMVITYKIWAIQPVHSVLKEAIYHKIL